MSCGCFSSYCNSESSSERGRIRSTAELKNATELQQKHFDSATSAGEHVISTLNVIIYAARHLRVADVLSPTSDPYCVCHVGHGRNPQRTRVVDKCLNPTWNQEFQFPIMSSDHFLKIDVFDRDRVSTDDWLGRILLPLHIFSHEPTIQWYPLQKRHTSDDAIPTGDLQVKIWTSNTALLYSEEVVEFFGRECDECGFGFPLNLNGKIAVEKSLNIEIIELFFSSCILLLSGRHAFGRLFLTNFRLLFFPLSEYNATNAAIDSNEDKERLASFSAGLQNCNPSLTLYLPLGFLGEITERRDDSVLQEPATLIEITSYDFRIIQLVFPHSLQPPRSVTNFFKRLLHVRKNIADFPITSCSLASAPIHQLCKRDIKEKVVEKEPGFDMKMEMKRLGVSASGSGSFWVLSTDNANYELVPTYPADLYIPTSVSIEDIASSVSFRSRGRFPALSWIHPDNKCVIARSAQPLRGLSGRSNEGDVNVLEAIRVSSGNTHSELVIFDARSQIAADANQVFNGKGTENLNDYASCRLLFMAIANIHAVRHSYEGVKGLVLPGGPKESDFLAALAATQWLSHLQTIARSASTIVHYVHENAQSVLIHCSDGWDRTSQLSSLAQLLLDPYYRTFEGFKVLIEKDWVSFGHKFKTRMLDLPSDPQGFSPVFLQFLDITHQFIIQFPEAFEFNSEFLISIYLGICSGWFNSFLFNCERDRVMRAYKEDPSFSLWKYLLAPSSIMRFMNKKYQPLRFKIIFPICSVKTFRFWEELYLRYDEMFYDRFSRKVFTPFSDLRLLALGESPEDNAETVMSLHSQHDLESEVESSLSPKRKESLSLTMSSRSLSLFLLPTDDEEGVNGIGIPSFKRVFSSPQSSATSGRGRDHMVVTQSKIQWVPNEEQKECGDCKAPFTYLRRKHHCRMCGRLFCNNCSSFKIQLKGVSSKKQRVCRECLQEYRGEEDYVDLIHS